MGTGCGGGCCQLVLLGRHLGPSFLAKREDKKYVREIYFLQNRAKQETRRMKYRWHNVQRKNEAKINCKKEKGAGEKENLQISSLEILVFLVCSSSLSPSTVPVLSESIFIRVRFAQTFDFPFSFCLQKVKLMI